MGTINFSANTGYLWQDRSFTDRIQLAKLYGFHSLEFHDEALYEDRVKLKEVLSETGLGVNSLNVRVGKTFGCAAIPDQADQAKRDIEQVIEVAEDIGALAIHILAGITDDPRAGGAYRSALQYALKGTELMILIEPVCNEQLPGFYLRNIKQAGQVLADINHPNLKIMFDCYHVFSECGELEANFASYANQIGHVQIAAAENRAEPFAGVIDYSNLLPQFQKMGYSGAFGCEYRPSGQTEDGLSWLDVF